MFLRTLACALSLAPVLLTGCSSTPMMELDLRSDPVGAQVYMSRRGEKAVTGKLGPVKGNVRAESLEEDFVFIGTAPLTYSSPLSETESDARVLGFGGKVVRKYKDGVIRFEKPGFETVERHVRFQDGELKMKVSMPKVDG